MLKSPGFSARQHLPHQRRLQPPPPLPQRLHQQLQPLQHRPPVPLRLFPLQPQSPAKARRHVTWELPQWAPRKPRLPAEWLQLVLKTPKWINVVAT